MLEQRSLKTDLAAIGLLAVAVFLGLALLTYGPADPPSQTIYPAQPHVKNLCGRSGALAANLLFEGLGLTAYYFVLSLAVFDAILLARRPIGHAGLRTVGWVLSIAGLATLSSMALPHWSPGPVIGAGGYLGATGRGLLEMNFAQAGSYIVIASMTVGGLLLCTDYVLVRMVLRGLGLSAVGVRTAHRKLHPAAKSAEAEVAIKRPDTDDVELNVRIRGKHVSEDAKPVVIKTSKPEKAPQPAPKVVVEEETETAEAEAAEADSEEPESAEPVATGEKPAKKGMGERLAGALRIKNPNKDKDERQEVMQELDAASRVEEVVGAAYDLPSIELLLPGEHVCYDEHEKDVRRKAKILEKTFASFGFTVKVVEIETGPVIAQFEIELESGLRLSKITSLADDLAIALRVPSVRIVAPIPGKNTVGIEVPNKDRQLVRLREVIEESAAQSTKMRIPIFLGKDVSGKPMVVDLSTLPHLLIAGRTGTGKSVCLNTIIASMLMTRKPDEVRMLMIDPKMVELSAYKSLPHLMHPVVTDMRKAEAILAWAVEKMEERYALLARAGVRHIGVYNQLGEEELMDRLQPECDEERKGIPTSLPYIVIVADEIADLMMTSGKEVEQHIIRLAQKSRAVGIHLVLATQKPTVDVITGLIKSNLPARIAFQVASRTDSRVVLDEMGADKLLGNGDMLFLWPGTSMLLRGQGTYVSDDEINAVVDCVGTTEPQFVKELVQLKAPDAASGEAGAGKLPNRDDLYEAAVDVVVREGRGSVSLLQRALGIGYGRAARLVDFMAEDGIVGTYNGSQAREVLLSPEQWAEMSGQEPEPAEPQRTRGKIVPEADDADDVDEPPALPAPRAKSKKRIVAPVEIDEDEEEYDDEVEDDESDAGEDTDSEFEEVGEDEDRYAETA